MLTRLRESITLTSLLPLCEGLSAPTEWVWLAVVHSIAWPVTSGEFRAVGSKQSVVQSGTGAGGGQQQQQQDERCER